ncbi:MAG: hypothetical protein LRY35_05550 [Clostridiales bacterium]|nr:hypothetical protein [Clostridiales bacterium]
MACFCRDHPAADFLAIDLILLTALVYTLAGLYEWNRAEKDRLFLFLFTAMQGLINGIFLSGDLFNLFVLLEVATLVNSVLIMFKKRQPGHVRWSDLPAGQHGLHVFFPDGNRYPVQNNRTS